MILWEYDTTIYFPTSINPLLIYSIACYTASTTGRRIQGVIRLKVKEIAQQKGISQGRLSRTADIDIKTIQRIYRFPTTIITTETLDKIARALGVDASELIESLPDDAE